MKSVQKILDKKITARLLVIFPHPDDETVMTGNLILKSIKAGWQVKVVSLTEGSRGRVHIHGRGRSVAQMRRQEFIKAMKILGVGDYEMWKEEDGKLIESDLWKIRVKRLIESFQPDIVVTYDLSGVTGHPDHIELGRQILKLKRDLGFELWWPIPLGKIGERFRNYKVEKYITKPELYLEVALAESLVKWKAIYQHLSQGMNKEFVWPFWWLAIHERVEQYAVARSKKYKFKRVKFKI